MNASWKTRAEVIAGAALMVAAGVTVTAGAAGVNTPTAVGTVSAVTDMSIARGLSFSREEERMARDLYQALADHYDGAMPFSRIVNSEQQHFDAVGAMLVRYGVSDPAAGRAAGTYADPAIQKLYDDWLTQGKTSLSAAYRVGVALEKQDIADLATAIASTSAADVKQLYSNLQRASERHLAAFEAAVEGWSMGGRTMGVMGDGPAQENGPGNGAGPGRMGGDVGTRNWGSVNCPMVDATS